MGQGFFPAAGFQAGVSGVEEILAADRQSVTIPAPLATKVQRLARKSHLTMSRALVVLAQRGVDAAAAAREHLNSTYRRFLSEADPERKSEAGKDLTRAIFGKDAVAEDSLL